MIDFTPGMLTKDILYNDLPEEIKKYWHPSVVKKAFAWYVDRPEIVVIPCNRSIPCYCYNQNKDMTGVNLANISPDRWLSNGHYGTAPAWRDD